MQCYSNTRRCNKKIVALERRFLFIASPSSGKEIDSIGNVGGARKLNEKMIVCK